MEDEGRKDAVFLLNVLLHTSYIFLDSASVLCICICICTTGHVFHEF